MKFLFLSLNILVFFSVQSQSNILKPYLVGQFELIDSSYLEGKNNPSYPGGKAQLYNDIYHNGVIVEGTLKTDVEYLIPVCLTITEDGTIEKISISSNLETDIIQRTNQLFESIRQWNPAVKRNGQPNQGTICFTLKYQVAEEPIVQIYTPPPPVDVSEPVIEDPETVIIDFPDKEASFPGDTSAMRKFIRNNMVYPVEAKENGKQGKVFVSFIVEIDGRLTDVKIERGVTWSLDEEAKRLVYLMPNWNPGQSRGKAVRTRMRLPIAFTLN